FAAPAQGVIKYHNYTFTTGFSPERSKWQGPPSPSVDEEWVALYNFGISRVTADEAAQFYNKTSEIPGDPGHYITDLDVFHQLHCLNAVRKLIWPEYYHTLDNLVGKTRTKSQEHLDHCIDSLRQSLMCSADVTPLYWVWSPKRNLTLPEARVTHTCRDFEAIRQWALERQMVVPFN
ncbi:hypothetical protein BT63DRAFT_359391, partial [Microthyrium microscopicum]